MPKQQDDQTFKFKGWVTPQYTMVPDQLFDELLPKLTESELKVLLYIIRRTFGFKKSSDDISLKQLVDGITTRDGRRLDYGAGVSKTSAVRGAAGLVEKNIIVAVRNRSDEKGDEATTYRLQMLDAPVSKSETPLERPVSTFESRGSVNLDQARDPDLDTQETVTQKTDLQDRPFEISNGQPTELELAQARSDIEPYIKDYAREFRDQAKLSSSVSRAVNLYFKTDLEMDEFVGALLLARKQTQKHSGSINAKAEGTEGYKAKMPYFFAVLTKLLGLKNDREEGAAD